ncbi:hypothetical protein AGABI1DRAFT_134133 [Agaricus bisporus var. burnettii JB137-S8]|uniref:Uncharacterized protein n=1 Tax=Agaricus bisporus var. burnettii (strain JB137-S8 / ATCC MYA-4627 / FGSC 10392) TaxID=597362 RepID=K5WT73_AGABU|nr:uncharacterized protein AGABI1DRAFT_134133 [Agaricus bisporus var. burnettii JB137-S8]EKM73762.1 hypothetical protein AGABI1DRAFT_134133 [Agaricus bisporus var. burnettii JB137-S8]
MTRYQEKKKTYPARRGNWRLSQSLSNRFCQNGHEVSVAEWLRLVLPAALQLTQDLVSGSRLEWVQVMTPPHAPSAQSGAGPGSRASDLTVATADDDRLVDEGAGRSARDGIMNVDPRDTSVTMGRCPHEADGVLEDGG